MEDNMWISKINITIDNEDDTSLIDVLPHILPESVLSDSNLDIIGFTEYVSKFQIQESLKRGENNISILDVYEKPNIEYLKKRAGKCNVTHFLNDKNLLNNDNIDTLNSLCYYYHLAYKTLFDNSLCGKYVNSFLNIISIYEHLNDKKNKWNSCREYYIRSIAPAAFWIFKDDYLSSRLFCRTATIENLISLVSSDGFSVDEEDNITLPLPIRNNLLRYVSSIPNIVDSDNCLHANQKSIDYHSIILTGIKTLSAITII